MRDVLITAVILAGAVMALGRPWVGVMLWTWISIMNPHRYTWGFAYNMPFAAIVAVTTLIGILFTRERESPFKAPVIYVLAIFMVWMTIAWLFGVDPAGDYESWAKVMKIDLMIFIALALLRSKRHIIVLAWVLVGSLAILGAKGGLFTILSGGSYRVYGPPQSYTYDNNDFALALVVVIPLVNFLRLQLASVWGRRGMAVLIILCAAAALGTQSRGGFLAFGAMALFFWWKGKNKLGTGLAISVALVAIIVFMPDTWMDRMESINDYRNDGSAMGRINAWWVAWRIALHNITGVGFNTVRPELFAQYSEYVDRARAAHSIYFQIMGEHGFIGLALFLCLGFMTWRVAGWISKNAPDIPETHWCKDLAAMSQASLAGYAVGGAFLSLAYFDLVYNILALLVLTKCWIKQQRWKSEPDPSIGKWAIPGLKGVGFASRVDSVNGAGR